MPTRNHELKVSRSQQPNMFEFAPKEPRTKSQTKVYENLGAKQFEFLLETGARRSSEVRRES